jgi:hypothetical protein
MDDSRDERQEVEPFEATVFPPRRWTIRNPGSRVFHCCLILPLLLVLALAITSLSYFAVTNDDVENLHLHDNGKCVLFAQYHKDDVDLSSGHACIFSIFGEVAVAVAAALLILWMIIKTAAGFHLVTCVLLCEIPVLVLHAVFAFCVSLTISIGLAITCGEYSKRSVAKGQCSNYTLPGPPTTPRDTVVFFHNNIYKSMVTSWVAMILLTLLLGVHVLLCILFCVRRVRSKSGHELLPVSDGESSSDGEDTDEAMVPIAELERR